ncbi:MULTISPECIES: 4-hydroxybenzoate octaprenyltransferase [Xenorhabdus]|uniref:4-hydroxybenzoate octaprenyltransferase n=1 Tax=Xenorhabdus ehlersii TaxID=290111 RepID=A0A2D0IVB1_9GAMM|nr:MULTISPECIES: 4-hydroxybenzoate octaprenyltransferase [Xenorhabdus]MBC8948029.1 4-hydroxybenzoate octaprenyltransferase [Xenorhabdus sp. TS4]PHM25840.1 4-hydroxybenzoate octaprenyltransferase [Xenorhabdus ehlersii]RKE87053.1 4-hydroxybenzoate polyprenyltransferase [Xenorhabdus ehlersii]
MTRDKWHAYCRLMRIDKPIGTLLLLWPTYWALWIAAKGMPDLHIGLVFTLGVFFMRAAGCCINDFADRKFDGYVERTKSRPLPSGDITEKESKILFATLILISFALVLTLNKMTIALSVVGLALAWVYPFVKRVSHLPQVVLGAAYGWSIPMAFAAVSESLPLECWLLFLANIIWSVIYDTQYAMVDRDDDLKIGVKSTAVLFGRFDKLIIGILQFIMLGILVLVGGMVNLGGIYYWTVLLATALFVYQHKLLTNRERSGCFQAFMNNNYVGLVLFLGVFFSYV